MDYEQVKLQVAEHRKVIKALHQYMESQGINRAEWGLIFAKAAGYEVFHITQKCPEKNAETGGMLLMLAVNSWASEDRLNVK